MKKEGFIIKICDLKMEIENVKDIMNTKGYKTITKHCLDIPSENDILEKIIKFRLDNILSFLNIQEVDKKEDLKEELVNDIKSSANIYIILKTAEVFGVKFDC